MRAAPAARSLVSFSSKPSPSCGLHKSLVMSPLQPSQAVLTVHGTTSVLANLVLWQVPWLRDFPTSSYNNEQPKNPTLSAFGRASTLSLGSIAFGSLIVTILDLLRLILNAVQHNASAEGHRMFNSTFASANFLMRWWYYSGGGVPCVLCGMLCGNPPEPCRVFQPVSLFDYLILTIHWHSS
jgi:hypothetical protein